MTTKSNEQTTEEQRPPTTLTPASEWADTHLYRLPGCGHVARLRRPSLSAMATRVGQVSNPLSPELMRFLAVTDAKPAVTEEEQIESYCKHVTAYLHMAELAFVEPKFVLDHPPDYKKGEIGPGDLTD